MGGRPRKIIAISTGNISKAERAERKAQEEKLRINTDELKPPTWLDTAGKKEFKRVVKNFAVLNISDNLDLSVLATYCDAYSNFQKAAKIINKITAADVSEWDFELYEKTMRGYEKYAKIILQCSGKLGLATIDRLKLVQPKKKEEKPINKFAQFLDDDKERAQR